ncbi:hypothetical protein OROMI_029891 [Orobanche minor]
MISNRTMQTAAVVDYPLFERPTYKERGYHGFSEQYNSPYVQRECSTNFTTMPTLVDLEQISGDVFAEQMSTYDVGPTCSRTFANPTPGYPNRIGQLGVVQNNQTFNNVAAPSSLQNSRYRASPSNWIRQDTKVLPSNAFSKPTLSHGLISQCRLQATQSKQRRFQPYPPPAHLGPYGPQMNGFSVGQNNIQRRGMCNVQATKPADSIRPLHDILLSYMNDKYKLMDTCRTRQEFLNRLHLTACKGGVCKCQKYLLLITHFDKCRNTQCDVCEPVRQSFSPVEKKNTTGLGFRDEHYSESQLALNRMKMESNTVHNDDWSLGAIVRQHFNTTETNKEQTFEGFINSAKLDEEVPSSIGNIVGESFLRSDYAFDDEMMENGRVNADEVRSRDPSLSSDGISILSEELPMDEAENTKRVSEAELDIRDAECDLAKSDCKYGRKLEDLKVSGVSSIDFFTPEQIQGHLHILSEELPMDEAEDTKRVSEAELDTRDAECDLAKSDCEYGRKLEDLKVSGVSLIDFFTPEQIQEHLHSLKQCDGTSAGKGYTGDATVDASTCQLCDVVGRTFAPPPMYCTSCGARIKHGSNYYRPPGVETNVKHCFCTLCFKESRGGNISFRGLSFSKATLEKCKDTDEFQEGWVQCNKCEAWQHQICALYNSKQDLEGKLEYICPYCRLLEIEAKGRAFIPPASGARDLPRTKLSDHIEQRLLKSLEKERKQRAGFSGKSPEEVPGAEDLVVRVVLAANKELKVKQQFLDILHGETYPTEFPYKSKVLLLFQKVEGVDICLFAMYLQEFGSECGHPNKRSVYISYLDSVKYFRPDIRTVDSVALRTLVYHEILIGYLDYCKQRGFTTCYIWACPPVRGEDYILYCHPETQKTPNPHKLLQWYKKLLKKAKEENVVVEYTNFYNYFFVPSGECNSKITAARLPYFDGDYWSCAIEDMIRTIEKESEGVSEKRKLKIHTSKRALRAVGHSDLSVDKTKDILVMQKLGHTILPSKEDFFVVHLQFSCANCHEPILSESRWSCNQCTKFHLCRRCLELEQNSSGLGTHTNIHGEKHQLVQIPVDDVAEDTEDNDIVLDNDFFGNRQSFLKFCLDNRYQFDTLRRAKYSSMMILHHLKTTTAVTNMQTVCNLCQDKDAKANGLCDICSEFHAGVARTFLEALDELST